MDFLSKILFFYLANGDINITKHLIVPNFDFLNQEFELFFHDIYFPTTYMER